MKHQVIRVLLLVTVLSVTTSAPVAASDIVLDISESESYVIEYSAVNSEKTDVNNFFIRELAKFNLTGLYNTRFTYHYSINRRISEVDNHTLKVAAELHGEKCTGNVLYKGFDISDILMPEMADFNIVVEDNGIFVHSREFHEVVLNKDSIFSAEFEFEVLDNAGNYTFRIDQVRFYSETGDKEYFYDRIASIDSYYASIDALKVILAQYRNLDFTPANLPLAYLQIMEMERLYNAISHSDFLDHLEMSAEQSKELNFYLQEVKTSYYNHKAKYGKLMSTIEFLRLNQHPEVIARKYVEQLAVFTELSQEVTYSHRDYYYRLGLVHFTTANLNAYKNGLGAVLSKTKFCNDTDLVLQKLKQEIYKSFLLKSEDLILKEQYHLAKGVLTNAEDFYQTSMGQVDPLDLSIQMSKANYGIYNSYLHLIDRAIDIGNYELAENYIQKAKDFQKEHSTTIIANQFINRVSEELVTLYISKGVSLNSEGEYEEAHYCFEQANTLCVNLGKFNHDYIIKHGLMEARNGLYNQYIDKAKLNLEFGNDLEAKGFLVRAEDLASTYPTQVAVVTDYELIKSQLDYQVYLKNISEGKKFLSEDNYYMAYFRLLDALHLEESSTFPIYEPLPELFAEAAIPYLVDQCRLGEVKVKKNNIDEARAIYSECLGLQSLYGLEFEQELQSSLVLLNNSIFSKQCEMTTGRMEEMIAQSTDAIDCGDFMRANNLLDEAFAISADNYYCEFDMTAINDLQSRYRPAAQYQELASEAQKALESNDHARFSEIYQKMEQLSQSYEVIRKRIEPLPLYYLFSIKKNLAYLESSLSDYQTTQEFETALRILHVMEAGDVSGKDARNIQEQLAVKMAAADKATALNDDPRENVSRYTNGNSWYKHFRKAYLKSW